MLQFVGVYVSVNMFTLKTIMTNILIAAIASSKLRCHASIGHRVVCKNKEKAYVINLVDDEDEAVESTEGTTLVRQQTRIQQ